MSQLLVSGHWLQLKFVTRTLCLSPFFDLGEVEPGLLFTLNFNELVAGPDVNGCIVNIFLAEENTNSYKCCLSAVWGFLDFFEYIKTSTGSSLLFKEEKASGH